MNYEQVLRAQLLSPTNVNFLLSVILDNYKISQKAVPKCTGIITGYLTTYLANINRFPENKDELIDAINFLNRKCYDDFVVYLSKKYPRLEMYKKVVNGANDPGNGVENDVPNDVENGVPINPPISVPINPPISVPISPSINPPINSSISPPKPKCEEITILTEEEKNILLKMHGVQPPKPVNDDSSLMLNPTAIKIISMLSNQVSPKTAVVDEILDIGQVNKLLQSFSKVNKVNKVDVIDKDTHNDTLKDISKVHISSKTDKPIQLKQLQIMEPIDEQQIGQSDEPSIEEPNEPEPENHTDVPSDTLSDDITIDLDNITKEQMPLLNRKLKELIFTRNKYMSEKNHSMSKKISADIEIIADAMKVFKEKCQKKSIECESKINGAVVTSNKASSDNTDNIYDLNLRLDPTNDYTDQKNIVIELNSDDKICDITLVNYFLPKNPNNITRFNNKFRVYFNESMNRFSIPPGIYDIQTLITYITSQVNFLEFVIDDNNIITIKNTLGIKFDLMIDDESVFHVLGFSNKADLCKDKLFYSGIRPYDLDSNTKCFFNLSGSSMDKMEMVFNEKIELGKCLKKSRLGVHMKQMVLTFKNGLDQFYDFVEPFDMFFRVTYAS